MNSSALEAKIAEARNTPEYELEKAMLSFANDLHVLLEQTGVTRVELAERLGRKKSWVTRILSGEQNMTLKTMVLTLKELGYRLDISIVPIE